MTENAESKVSLIEEFKGLTQKQWLAIIGGFAGAAVLTVLHFALTCIGFLVIAVVLYMVPHITGVTSPKIKAVVGGLFIAIMLIIGTFAYASPSNDELKAIGNNDSIKDVSYNFEDNLIIVESDKDDLNLIVLTTVVPMISFGEVMVNEQNPVYTKTLDYHDGKYTTTPEIVSADINVLSVGIVDEDGKQTIIYRAIFDNGISSGDLIYKNFQGSGYALLLVGLMYFVMLIFSELMRRSARKARDKMEAEGRLYPEGYSKCKECGTMVLPGEITCRKFGAPIEVPEDVKVLHKKDFFECSECGTEVPIDAKVCPKCGAKFDEDEEAVIQHADGTVDSSSETFECSECGKEVPANAKRCPYCGAEFDEDEE